VIIGTCSLAQLDDNLKAPELTLPDAEMHRLDQASAVELDYPYDFLSEIQGCW